MTIHLLLKPIFSCHALVYSLLCTWEPMWSKGLSHGCWVLELRLLLTKGPHHTIPQTLTRQALLTYILTVLPILQLQHLLVYPSLTRVRWVNQQREIHE